MVADERVLAQGDRAGLDDAVVGPVAGEERVLRDHGAVAEGEHVGAHGHVLGEDRDAAPDLRAQRPEVERVEGRADEQGHRVPLDQRLDHPEAEVRKAPDRDLLGLPPADEHPLEQDRKATQADERRCADHDRPQVDVDHAGTGRDPADTAQEGVGGEGRVGHEEQELQSPAEEVPLLAGGHLAVPRGAHRTRPDRPQDLRSEHRRLRRVGRVDRGGRPRAERRGQARDRGVRVDVLHPDRGQVVALAELGAETRHHHRVGPQVGEEMRVDRNLGTDDLGQNRGQRGGETGVD